ncbi:signal transduction histidine kinase [Luteibacter sp. HA06]|jgi:signal transduction histidine kinase
MTKTSDEARRVLGDPQFRRDAAHALGTPLGGLLLQSELIDHLLRRNDIAKARTVAATLMVDCEGFGRYLREIFASMADMAEGGAAGSDPRECLERAMVDLGDETVEISYEGDSCEVSVPAKALEALMRRIAVETSSLRASMARLSGRREGASLVLTLSSDGLQRPELTRSPFAGDGLNLWTAREIAARHGGDLKVTAEGTHWMVVTLPLHALA